MSGQVNGTPAAPSASPTVQEFSIRVPKNVKKKYQVMRFTSSVNMDFSKWSQVKIERENNMREFRGNEEEIPKYGAGSEFGRDAREEARRKKYGIVSKKYRPEDQPWILKVGGKTGKKFRGIREGGITENAAYYVFTHSPDGGIDAFPLTEWYNFQPIQRYKALTAEEAEEEFGRRNKNWNLFSLMMRKRLNGGEEVEGEEPEEGKGKKSSTVKKKELKISDMDDWMDSEDDSGSNSNSEEEKQEKEEKSNKKGAKKGAPVKKKKKKASDDEAFEESDDGDEEGREVDYISDSSESESDHEGKAVKQLQGVAEEDALRGLLSSGEEDEDEEKKEEGGKESETEDKEKAKVDADRTVDKEKKSGTSSGKKLKKKKLKKVKKEENNADTSSDFSSDSSDSDSDGKKKQSKDSSKGSKEANSAGSSRSGTPTKDVLGGVTATPEKRKASSAILELNAIKKARLDNFASATLAPYTGDSRITEDAVRRYLMRKPMTTTELLQKFKSKKTGLTSDQLVNIMTQILKRINPVKQMIKDKMYLSIKA